MLKKRYCPWFDRLTMRIKPLKTRDLILSLSKDEAKIPCFFRSLYVEENTGRNAIAAARAAALPARARG